MHKRKVIFYTLIALVFLLRVGYINHTKKAYDKYLILGKTEGEYLSNIRNNLELTYAPNKDISPEVIERAWAPYMRKDCIKVFSTPNKKSKVDPKDVKLDIKYIGYAYGHHQLEGIPRIMAKLRVETPNRFWEFHLEMPLDHEGKIYRVMAY